MVQVDPPFVVSGLLSIRECLLELILWYLAEVLTSRLSAAAKYIIHLTKIHERGDRADMSDLCACHVTHTQCKSIGGGLTE